jgi:ACS family tartrate transporter-like MFS transporter
MGTGADRGASGEAATDSGIASGGAVTGHALASGASISAAVPVDSASVLSRTRRRLLPLLIVLFIVSYLDRVNVSFAKLTMNSALGIDDAVYAFGAGIFFIGYFLFEVPSNLILERVGARRWIARIMITWGLVSGATAAVSGGNSFIAMRLLLGMAEAGFFPGIILYLTYWFPETERARVIGLFMVGIPLTGLIGSPVSSELLGLDGWLGLQGWQWLLLIEALPAIVFGAACLVMLPDGPKQASWLTAPERQWLADTLAAERAAVQKVGRSSLRAAFTSGRVWALALVYFGIVLAVYGLGFWLPTLVHSFGIAVTRVGWITMLPFACSAPFMVWVGRHSDRKNERVWHLIGTSLLGFAGFAGASLSEGLVPQVCFLCVAAMGVYGTLPIFWTFPTAFLASTAAAAGIAFINSVGNLGGYFGPQIVEGITRLSGGFGPALMVLGLEMLVPVVVVLMISRRRRSQS